MSHANVMDKIISDALENARKEAVESVFSRFGSESQLHQVLRTHVVDYLRTPEGTAKIIALADKTIESLMLKTPTPRY